MSELTKTRESRTDIHWQLLTTVSAVALLASIYATSEVRAADSDRPLLWIELDGQFAQEENGQETFLPPFMLASPFDGASHTGVEKGSSEVWDKGAKVTFQPSGSDWMLSLSARYGKSDRSDVREDHPLLGTANYYSAYQHFAAQSSEGHVIVDFQVGKDVGLGKFGDNGSSVISAGLRIAQFNSRSRVDIKSQPTNLPTGYNAVHKFYATFAAMRKFAGIGPSLSWDASATVAGNPTNGSITLDWGVNGALLFGRQRATMKRQTAEYRYFFFTKAGTTYHTATPAARDKSVTVPNLGGFAGVSWRYPNAKVSVGYRADFFVGAMDGGIDAAHRENVGFCGPFASVSIGIGG
jgi:iron complex outermembrane receptor protein